MSLTYNSFVSEMATLTVISSNTLVSGDTIFGPIMPGIIDYAEGRLYRDLDLLAASVTDTSVICTSGVRSIFMSTTQGTLLVMNALNLYTPPGATSSNATRVPLMPVAQSVVDMVYPSAASSNCGLPEFFARIGDTQLIFGPTPDQAYGTEITATIRPNALSASNSSTWLTINAPELMIAAGMIFASGYMRNYGSQSDDPKMAASWESQYNLLMKEADIDSMRMKFESEGWSADAPTTIATPPRA